MSTNAGPATRRLLVLVAAKALRCSSSHRSGQCSHRACSKGHTDRRGQRAAIKGTCAMSAPSLSAVCPKPSGRSSSCLSVPRGCARSTCSAAVTGAGAPWSPNDGEGAHVSFLSRVRQAASSGRLAGPWEQERCRRPAWPRASAADAAVRGPAGPGAGPVVVLWPDVENGVALGWLDSSARLGWQLRSVSPRMGRSRRFPGLCGTRGVRRVSRCGPGRPGWDGWLRRRG